MTAPGGPPSAMMQTWALTHMLPNRGGSVQQRRRGWTYNADGFGGGMWWWAHCLGDGSGCGYPYATLTGDGCWIGPSTGDGLSPDW